MEAGRELVLTTTDCRPGLEFSMSTSKKQGCRPEADESIGESRSPTPTSKLVAIDPPSGVWDRVFTVAPLVLVGTIEPDGGVDLAPKHMVVPLGHGPYVGFVCTPRHATYRNARREGSFTVSYLQPDQVVLSGLTAAPRCEDGSKPVVELLDVVPAGGGRSAFVEGAYLFLDCRTNRVIDGFGDDSLVVGEITAAYADERALRMADGDDHDTIAELPLLAYLAPGRWSKIRTSFSFPYPAGFER